MMEILYGDLMNILYNMHSIRDRIVLFSFKGGHILLMKGTFLHMEELVGGVEVSERKWDTSREVEASPPKNSNLLPLLYQPQKPPHTWRIHPPGV